MLSENQKATASIVRNLEYNVDENRIYNNNRFTWPIEYDGKVQISYPPTLGGTKASLDFRDALMGFKKKLIEDNEINGNKNLYIEDFYTIKEKSIEQAKTWLNRIKRVKLKKGANIEIIEKLENRLEEN